MITAAQITKLRGSPWEHSFKAADLVDIFQDQGSLKAMMYMAQFSLAWFVEQTFNNQQGKPLKLQPFQMVMLNMLWHKKFPLVLATRGAGKTFMLAVYSVLRAMLVPGSKIVICGAGFRQAKLVFKYIEQLYNSSPLIQEACKDRPKYGSDQAYLTIGLSTITAIPIGDGEKIRGLRATVLIADEFASIPEEIFDIVLKPFTAVHANPAERAMITAFLKRMRDLDAPEELIQQVESTQDFGNQVIVSGTASYKHNHFYRRYETYRMFIESQGDARILKRALEDQSLGSTGKVKAIDDDDVARMTKMWGHYAVYQLPYQGLPEGFLDEDTIRSDRALMPTYRFAMEYEAKFPDDSDGFIRRSWIENATPKTIDDNAFFIELYGDPRATYVMGVDPARQNDNLGVVVIKLIDGRQQVVYCNAWDKTEWHVSAARVREICKRFNPQYIAMDKGGGGLALLEWLYKKQDGVEDADLIWPVQDQIEAITGNMVGLSAPGRKIVDMVNFSPTWISEAAHGLAASIQQCNTVFPHRGDDVETANQYARHFNISKVGEFEREKISQDLWGIDDWEAENGRGQRTIGISQHITECVNETCAILRNVTPNGTEQFNLPKLSEQPEGLDMRRRDRWSALLLANYAAKAYHGHGHATTNIPGIASGGGGRRKSMTGRRFRRKGSAAY